MAGRENNPPFSLHALIERTARILRYAANPPSKSKKTLSKSTPLSHRNKIEQIALLLRTEAKKAKQSKKKNSR